MYKKCLLIIRVLLSSISVLMPLLLFGQGAGEPYTYTIPEETMQAFATTGQAQTEITIKLNLPSLMTNSASHNKVDGYIEVGNRVCRLNQLVFEGGEFSYDCVQFQAGTIDYSFTAAQEAIYRYFCDATCTFNNSENTWQLDFKIGKYALSQSHPTNTATQQLFDDPANNISVEAHVQLTTDYIVRDEAAAFSMINSRQNDSLDISSSNENICRFTFTLSMSSISITDIRCEKSITGGQDLNIASISDYQQTLNLSASAAGAQTVATVQYQALSDDCVTTHISGGRDIVSRTDAGLDLNEHFSLCMQRCSDYDDCMGFSFNTDTTQDAQNCYLKSSACGVGVAPNTAINTLVDTTGFVFYKKIN